MVIIEVDCFRRLEAGIVLPDDDLVAQGMTAAQIHAARMAQLAEARSASGFATAFPNDPLQSIQPYDDDDYDSEADMYVRRLSTITERTEKTEYTEVPARSLASASVAFSNRRNTRALSSVTDSSYGELIGKSRPHAMAYSAGSFIRRVTSWSAELTDRSEYHTAVSSPVCFAAVPRRFSSR
jgi:hypothetical protein